MYIHLIKIGLFSLKLKMFYFYENKDTKNMTYFLQGLDFLNTLSSLPPYLWLYTHSFSKGPDLPCGYSGDYSQSD